MIGCLLAKAAALVFYIWARGRGSGLCPSRLVATATEKRLSYGQRDPHTSLRQRLLSLEAPAR